MVMVAHFFILPRRLHGLKRLQVIVVRFKHQENLFPILGRIGRFLQASFSTKSLVKTEQNDLFQPEKILKIISHVGYSIRYCKIVLL